MAIAVEDHINNFSKLYENGEFIKLEDYILNSSFLKDFIDNGGYKNIDFVKIRGWVKKEKLVYFN